MTEHFDQRAIRRAAAILKIAAHHSRDELDAALAAARRAILHSLEEAGADIDVGRSASVDGRNAHILLKKSEIEPPRKSRFRARRVISGDSPHGRACRRSVRGKTGRSAEPPSNFPSRLPAVV